MMHEVVELVKALAAWLWPLFAFYFLHKFGREIRELLREVPNLFRRVRSADLFGAKFKLDALEHNLSLVQKEAPGFALPPGEVPRVNEGGSAK